MWSKTVWKKNGSDFKCNFKSGQYWSTKCSLFSTTETFKWIKRLACLKPSWVLPGKNLVSQLLAAQSLDNRLYRTPERRILNSHCMHSLPAKFFYCLNFREPLSIVWKLRSIFTSSKILLDLPSSLDTTLEWSTHLKLPLKLSSPSLSNPGSFHLGVIH